MKNNENPSQDWLQAAEATFQKRSRINLGERVEAKLISKAKDSFYLDLGQRFEGVISKIELTEEDQKALLAGESITVYPTSFRDSLFTCSRRPTMLADTGDSTKNATLNTLKEAFEAHMAVDGKVKGTNKVGFEITMMGMRAYCPFSQMERGYCQDPQSHIGRSYPFLITQFEEMGRNIVVSRRELLVQEEKRLEEEVWKTLQKGDEKEGKVTSLKDYGAFVDIGGVEGLVHVSEISHQKVSKASDFLTVGQQVKVLIKEIRPEERRLSLSIKALQEDPWDDFSHRFKVGDFLPGKVVRMEKFGAFVQLIPGVEGLLHVSRMGTEKRVSHPKEVLAIGQEVSVQLQEMDLTSRRLSLSIEKPAPAEEDDVKMSRQVVEEARASRKTTMGDLFADALKKNGE